MLDDYAEAKKRQSYALQNLSILQTCSPLVKTHLEAREAELKAANETIAQGQSKVIRDREDEQMQCEQDEQVRLVAAH